MSTIDDDRDAHANDDDAAGAGERRRRTSCRGSKIRSCPTTRSSGRALIAVVAIMTFLASLTTGAVMLVRAAAGDWQSEVAREVTIQVRAAAGRDIEADVARAAEIARGIPGIADVRAYSREESARLLEPWLGTGLALDDLPVPRIVVVRLAADAGARPRAAAQAARRAGAAGARSTTTAASSTACARWRMRRCSAGIAMLVLVLAGDGAVGDVRNPRRDGGQPRRSSRCCISSAPRTASSPDTSSAISCCSACRAAPSAAAARWRCSRWPSSATAGFRARRRRTSSRPCSALLGRDWPAMSRCRTDRADRVGGRVYLAGHRQPDARSHPITGGFAGAFPRVEARGHAFPKTGSHCSGSCFMVAAGGEHADKGPQPRWWGVFPAAASGHESGRLLRRLVGVAVDPPLVTITPTTTKSSSSSERAP